jgi:hypothetical protein
VGERICSVLGCGKRHEARGWCPMHYRRWRLYGDPLLIAPPRHPDGCAIEDCDRSHYANGWCENHYARLRRHGGTHDKRAERRDPVERFWEKVDKNGLVPTHRPDLGPCWLWTDAPNGSGYGSFKFSGAANPVGAHVAAVLLDGGEVPSGYEPDHLCYVRICVRRSHLDVVTAAENKRRQRPRRRLA